MPDAGTSNPALVKSTVVGTILQLIMVLAGHYSPAVANQFATGGLVISALAGVLFSVWRRPASGTAAAAGGVIAGGVSAFLGILVSYLLGELQPSVLVFGTAGSIVSGAMGGVLGKLFGRKAA
jgi:hypothetical protein